MADEEYRDYSNGNEMHHMRRDLRDAHTNAQLAKWLSIMAMILAAIALWVAVSAMNKAGDAQSTANRATESVNQTQSQ